MSEIQDKSINNSTIVEEPKKKRGRPRKTDVAAKKHPGKVGRPKGTAAIMNDYKARMLASPKSSKVLQTVLEVATDPEHPNFTACAKMVMDRILPAGSFDREASVGKGLGGIQINISGVGSVGVQEASKNSGDDIIEGEYTDVN